MSEKRKTINEILFDSTYYRNHCTDEYKDSILKDLILVDSGISYKEFIKKNNGLSDNTLVHKSTKSYILSSNCQTSPFAPLP